MWDVASSTLVAEYEAHAKRIWSLDYCAAPGGDPTLLASASDDCTVKLWSTRSPGSVGQVRLRCLAVGRTCPLAGGLARWLCGVRWLAGGHGRVAGRGLCYCCCNGQGSGDGCFFATSHSSSCPAYKCHPAAPPHAPLCCLPGLQLDLKANVCAVKWRPGSEHELAVGSADHCAYLYDLRAPAQPLATFAGHRWAAGPWCRPGARGRSQCALCKHLPSRVARLGPASLPTARKPRSTEPNESRGPQRALRPALAAAAGCRRKAVSYVRFAGPGELVSASTDSTLRLWSLAAGGGGDPLRRVYEGHVNEKNFVGLAGERGGGSGVGSGRLGLQAARAARAHGGRAGREGMEGGWGPATDQPGFSGQTLCASSTGPIAVDRPRPWLGARSQWRATSWRVAARPTRCLCITRPSPSRWRTRASSPARRVRAAGAAGAAQAARA